MTQSVSSPKGGITDRHQPHFGALGRNRAWMLALGVVAIVMGVVGVVIPFTLAIIDAWYVGELLLVVGLAQAAVIPLCKGWKGVYWHAAIAAVYGIGGIAVLTDPLLSSGYTGFVVAGVLLAAGFARIAITRQLRGRSGWRWIMVAGLAALLSGVIILSGGPLSGLFGVALFLSLEMLLQGASCLAIAAAVRRQTQVLAG